LELPAARAAATAAAVSTTTPTAISAPTTAATATATGATRSALLGFVDSQRATAHLKAIGLLDGVLRFTGTHVDECKSSRPSGLSVIDELDGFDFAVTLEQRADFIFCRSERQVANVDRRHSTNLTYSFQHAGINALASNARTLRSVMKTRQIS
jgi:hypothetical protein